MSSNNTRFCEYKDSSWERAELAQTCGVWGFWGFAELDQALKSPNGYRLFYLEKDKTLRALALLKVEPFSSELIYLYVPEKMRNESAATTLLLAVKKELMLDSKQESLFCEVRESNKPARALYDKCGFILINRRKGYYSDGEDGLSLALKLEP